MFLKITFFFSILVDFEFKVSRFDNNFQLIRISFFNFRFLYNFLMNIFLNLGFSFACFFKKNRKHCIYLFKMCLHKELGIIVFHSSIFLFVLKFKSLLIMMGKKLQFELDILNIRQIIDLKQTLFWCKISDNKYLPFIICIFRIFCCRVILHLIMILEEGQVTIIFQVDICEDYVTTYFNPVLIYINFSFILHIVSRNLHYPFLLLQFFRLAPLFL